VRGVSEDFAPLWTGAAIATATGGVLSEAFEVDGVSFDSRELIGGELFVALTGEHDDGHRFVSSALDRGAAGLLVSQAVDAPHVHVPDTMAALSALAVAARARTNAMIIGVTGSVGKTGVKEALRLALGRAAPDRVHASVRSYNNHTGVPLSLARMPTASRFGVFEMGMNHAGELTALTKLVRPSIALVTWVTSAHAEFFADEAAIADAKGEIFAGLEPGGIAVIPYDSDHRDRLIGHAMPHANRIITFGFGKGADVRAADFALLPDCTTARADVFDERLIFKVGMAGKHWLNNALGVLAVVHAAGGDLALAGLALAELSDLPGRGARRRVQRSEGTAVVIDESYNANPASMIAALGVLGGITPERRGRRLALLGAMGELGRGSEAFHAGLAPAIEAAGVARAVLVGSAMRPLADVLRLRTSTALVDDAAAALALIETELAADDVLLVKGSNAMKLGTVVAGLIEERMR
jgi:UDP-N-acetylmuramoyl-tripeptide--D-alanyl-D-alanine ligase